MRKYLQGFKLCLMARFGTTPFVFPEFRGAARRLVLVNLIAFFAFQLASLAHNSALSTLLHLSFFDPQQFLQGAWWQPFTYSLVHPTLFGTLFELLTIWFLVSFLEISRDSSWVTGLYVVSVLGTALSAALIALLGLGSTSLAPVFYGCIGGTFGLLIAIGLLHGEVQFQLFFIIGIKARYLAAIYALVTIAMLFGEQRLYAFALLGGALAGYGYIRLMPRRGFKFGLSERWYSLRNQYFRWRRRRAARKFQVYMNRQGRVVHFDGQGKYIDDKDDDKSRWN